MKILIFSILLVFCFQFCSAKQPYGCSSCEDDLAQLWNNARIYVTKAMDKTYKVLEIISGTSGSCSKLHKTEHFFISGKYAPNYTEARKNVKSFSEIFKDEGKQFVNEFAHSVSINDEIHQDAEAFSKNNDLRHQFLIFGSGCDAQLNTFKRQLSNLIRQICTITANIDASMKVAKCSVADASKIAEEIGETVTLTDKECDEKKALCMLKEKISALFCKFYNIHSAGHRKFTLAKEHFDQLLILLSPLIVKFECAM